MRQGDLFEPGAGAAGAPPPALALERHQLLAWQERLATHQGPLFTAGPAAPVAEQGLLLAEPDPGPVDTDPLDPDAQARALDPLSLQPQSLSFWRWPEAPQRGAAIYLVLDRPPHLPLPLLLYVGETGRADRRWKGDHDCKTYLAAYGEALRRADLDARPSIRFWSDVPEAVKARRALEQALIRRWLPPFNKETAGRWSTPFTADQG
ncbi:GIY-YIG nuclease family protein [Cyanobium sp. FGCU-52]|nr:GIY-YIG nuclease family protein [Cyanobium sp. FGCU52]